MIGQCCFQKYWVIKRESKSMAWDIFLQLTGKDGVRSLKKKKERERKNPQAIAIVLDYFLTLPSIAMINIMTEAPWKGKDISDLHIMIAGSH